MTKYIYIAKDKTGKTEQSAAEAPSQDDLLRRLQAKGLTVISISEEYAGKAAKAAGKTRMHMGLKSDDLVLYARQLSTLVGAGVPILRSLNLLSSQIQSRSLYLANEQIRKDVEAGSTLKDALAKHPKIFSNLWINLVETGELSGQLPLVLNQLSSYLESSISLRRKITSAMVYPGVLLFAAIGVMVFFVGFLIPMFERIFKDANVQLPLISKLVIDGCNMIRNYSIPGLIVIIVIIILIRAYIKTEKGRLQFDKLKLAMPVFGGLFHMEAEEEFASGLAILTKSGVPILYALEVLGRTSSNRVTGLAIESVRESVREGKTIAEPLSKSGVFSPMVIQMIAVGEETGELPAMLDKVSQYTRERLDIFTGRLATVVEPAMIIIMGFVVGVLAVSIYLPIFQMLTTVKM